MEEENIITLFYKLRSNFLFDPNLLKSIENFYTPFEQKLEEIYNIKHKQLFVWHDQTYFSSLFERENIHGFECIYYSWNTRAIPKKAISTLKQSTTTDFKGYPKSTKSLYDVCKTLKVSEKYVENKENTIQNLYLNSCPVYCLKNKEKYEFLYQEDNYFIDEDGDLFFLYKRKDILYYGRFMWKTFGQSCCNEYVFRDTPAKFEHIKPFLLEMFKP